MASWDPVQQAKDTAKDTVSGGGNILANVATGGTYGASRAAYDNLGIGSQIASATGLDNSKQNALAAQSQALTKEQYDALQPYLDKASANEQGYLQNSNKDYKILQQQSNAAANPYLAQLGQLNQSAADQATNAQKTYDATIQPRLQGLMEQAGKEAGGAMTLAQAGDPNNSVAQAYRDLYEKQAVGEGNRGKADYGVLSALGAQATAGQLGGLPAISGSQLQLLNSQNQSQASQAYTNTQQRMAALRDQGLNQGIAQSAAQYDRGQQAIDRYGNSINGLQNAQGVNLGQQQGLRGEQQGYGSSILGVNQGLANLNYQANSADSSNQLQFGQNDINRREGSLADYYGAGQQGIQNQIGIANANNASKQALATGILSAGATLGGAAIGGAGGAKAGQVAGNSVGNGVAYQMGGNGYQYQPQYGSYK